VRGEASSTAGRLGEAIAHSSSSSSLLHRGELGRGSALSLDDGSRIEVELVSSSDKSIIIVIIIIEFFNIIHKFFTCQCVLIVLSMCSPLRTPLMKKVQDRHALIVK
jgi:hypothetical protein